MPTPNPYARQFNTTAAQRYRRTRMRIPTPPNRSPSPNNTPPRTPPSPTSSPSHTTSTRKTRGYAGKPSTKHRRKHKRTKHRRTKHKRTKKRRKHTAKKRRRRR